MGLTFTNPLGLAAGYDKDGLGWRGLACLGFGHIELGTVTPLPQPGNPQPRVFRLVEERAVINRMGFPGPRGATSWRGACAGRGPRGLVLGVNIGKNKDTPLNEAAVGITWPCCETFAPLADYLAVNVSSPNTPGLRALQTRQALEGLLGPLAARRRDAGAAGRAARAAAGQAGPRPGGGRSWTARWKRVLGCGMDGVILTNTTLRRDGLRFAAGGRDRRLERRAAGRTSAWECSSGPSASLDGRLPVVASGGVMCAADAQARLDAGAALVQLYTGLIYEGPGLVREILDAGLKNKN